MILSKGLGYSIDFMLNNDSVNFNKRITIQEQFLESDDSGGFIEKWNDIGNFWAKISPISANQNFVLLKKYSSVTHLIEARYSKYIKPNQKIIYQNREFRILSVITPDENRLNNIKIVASEVVKS